MTSHRPDTLPAELRALGPAGRRRAAGAARDMLAAELSQRPGEIVDPVPVVVDDDAWQDLVAGLTQRARLLDELYGDLYGPRTVLTGDVAPAEAVFADPAYLRPAVGMPAHGAAHLHMLTCRVTRTAEGRWMVLEDSTDTPGGSGLAIELRRVLSRSVPSLYRSTPLHRLQPFFDTVRTSLHARLRADGRAGRLVVLIDEAGDAQSADHRLLASLLGAPVVSATDLVIRDGSVRLHAPAGTAAETTGVDAIWRLVPSAQVDPLDLGPTPLGGVTGLTEAARRGEVAVLNPIGAGILENPALRAALPDLCRQVLHEDLRLHSPAGPLGPERATALSLDPDGGEELVERPVTLQVMVVAGESGYEVLPGGIARTDDDAPPALKDVWVLVPEPSSAPEGAESRGEALEGIGALPSRTAITPSIGTDLFWFGRYLERVDQTARMLRTVVDVGNDLRAERSASALTARTVLLRAVTDVTATYPGFTAIDPTDGDAVDAELASVVTDVSRPGSLGQSFRALEHSTLSLRDLVGEDIWPALTRMRETLRAPAALEGPLEQSLTVLVDGCLTLTGAITESMSRGTGRDLWEAGRRIERALGLLALLGSVFSERRSLRLEQRVCAAVATITGASTAFRRAYRSPLHPELLAEMLLADAALPRSLAFQVERLREAVDRLPDTSATSEVRSLLADLRSRTESLSARSLLQPEAEGSARTGVPAQLGAARDLLRTLSTALEEEFFRAPERTAAWGIDDV
ncbi:circularly permuted type 2 ATP-grasp protein [Brachybacterium phenoliresistens]|uniref:circularly permuted type 2 ATP-grasp protein n=1 Tax=Brachybacterium phenoliresistens TaxID=396014 RepID=UPI0031D301E8